MANKLNGSLNLAKLKDVFIYTFHGKTATKKCVCIPIDDNDLFIKDEVQDGKRSLIYGLGVDIYQKRETDQYGNTHYAKLAVHKDWIEKHTDEELAELNKIYLCDFKPFPIGGGNQAETVQSQGDIYAQDGDELPF